MYTVTCKKESLEYHCKTKHEMELLYLALSRSNLIDISKLEIDYFDRTDGTVYDVDLEQVYFSLYEQGILEEGIDFTVAYDENGEPIT